VSIVDDRERVVEVIVEDKQLSLAIGKKGQNVRLAAKLLGWKIDIKSEEEKRQDVEQQMSQMAAATATPLENVPGLGEGLVEKLNAAGVTTVEALADMTPEQLEAIEGIGPKTVEKISLAVNNYFSSLEGAPVEAAEQEQAAEGAGEQPLPDEQAAEAAEGAAEASTSAPPSEEEPAPEEAVSDLSAEATADAEMHITSTPDAAEEGETADEAEEPANKDNQ
jgi:N utilization substance protein A